MKRAGKTIECFNDIRKYLYEHKVPCLQFIRDGKVEILYTQKYIDEKDKEIERLNNIINELEKYLEDYHNNTGIGEYETGIDDAICDILKKLRELKGDVDSENI